MLRVEAAIFVFPHPVPREALVRVASLARTVGSTI
jgi:hypothetical protein